jgi:phospholipase/lecithinase/hemolysin
MRASRYVLALLTAVALAACGGDDDNGQGFATRFSAQVTFGDSLSDVGSYAVGTVRELGGGKFTINGDNTARSPDLTGKNWTELMAAQFGLPAPCPAQTGLQGDAARGFLVPVQDNPGCYGYAQGGARVRDPVGPGNALTGSPLGALTVPVAQQIARHLVVAGGRFRGDEVVFVAAGGNDVLAQLTALTAGATAAGASGGPAAAAAYVTDNSDEAVAAMAEAGADLATLVRTELVGRGANFVVVNNLADVASTPLGAAQSEPLQALIAAMVAAFNEQLLAGLAGEERVLLVDVHSLIRDQVSNPGAYGITNSNTPACGPNPLEGSSLVCNGSNVLPGGDVGRYLFADTVHLTPFGYALVAEHVSAEMMEKGWL